MVTVVDTTYQAVVVLREWYLAEPGIVENKYFAPGSESSSIGWSKVPPDGSS
ncbi:MAG: hypothetical protein HKN80_05965 [Acidimicrobiia bacterium]|nr:hypothetical protein [Acidimicrobiia bacterium]